MKNILSAFILVALVSGVLSAQSKKYIATMETSIKSLYDIQVLEEFDPIINKFSRIGQAEKTQWEPYYYESQASLFKAFRIEDLQAKDGVLDQALDALTKATKLSPNNVEIILMEGFINMIKISVDPGTRGQTLSPGIMANFGKAMAMDPTNPRATLFMGQMQIGTAQFFGTGVEEPCALIEKSIQLFDEAKPSSPIAPTWGRPSAVQYQGQCKTMLASTSN
jgi:hypothetical protein